MKKKTATAKTHPTSTSLFEGLIIFIFVTLRSMISAGMSNSSTMQSGIAPPQGCSVGGGGVGVGGGWWWEG